MEEKDQLRINELARKKKTLGLTPEEQAEQARLYHSYIEEMKDLVKKSLQDEGIQPKDTPS